jgi:uncharacterized protein YajQ (UPF0234 family)
MAVHSFDVMVEPEGSDQPEGLSDVPAEPARAMIDQIAASKLPVQPRVEGGRLRVASKSKDALQETQALLRANAQGLTLAFTNYRSA